MVGCFRSDVLPAFVLAIVGLVTNKSDHHSIILAGDNTGKGKLTVYMRLNNIDVPSIYGPSADDRSFDTPK